jgi:predicted CXXCH cytochrome family protein
MDLEACIQCVVCHSNHAVLSPTDDMLGVDEGSSCTGCHVEGEAGYEAAATMGMMVNRLEGTLHEADELLASAARAGVEVGPDAFALQAARDRLIESRVLVHSFDLPLFLEASEDGVSIAEEGIAAGHRAFDELRVRRTGLGLSLIVIIGAIVALVLKIRAMEKGGDVG